MHKINAESKKGQQMPNGFQIALWTTAKASLAIRDRVCILQARLACILILADANHHLLAPNLAVS
jgi:hypothetical protein